MRDLFDTPAQRLALEGFTGQPQSFRVLRDVPQVRERELISESGTRSSRFRKPGHPASSAAFKSLGRCHFPFLLPSESRRDCPGRIFVYS